MNNSEYLHIYIYIYIYIYVFTYMHAYRYLYICNYFNLLKISYYVIKLVKS